MEPPSYKDGDAAALEKKIAAEDGHASGDSLRADDASIRTGEDVLGLQDTDPALNMKMHLVNNVSISCRSTTWASWAQQPICA